MARTVLTWMITYGSFVVSLLCLGMPDAIAEQASSANQSFRDELSPTEPQPLDSRGATDLEPLNPDPDLLDLPQDASDVEIDLTQPITLVEALILAHRNNRGIKDAELNVNQAQARLNAAKSTRLPRVVLEDEENQINRSQDIFVTNNREKPNSEGDLGQEDIFPPGTTRVEAAVEAQYDVLTSGQRPAFIQAAQKDLESNYLKLRVQLWELRLDVTNDYYAIQEAKELIRIAKSAVKNAEDSFKNAEDLRDAGLGTQFDVLRTKVQLADRQQQLEDAKVRKSIAQRSLAQRLSLADNANVDAKDSVKEVGEWPLSLEQSIVASQKFRAELADVLTEREIFVLNEKIAKNSVGPFLSVTGRLSTTASLRDIGTPDRDQGPLPIDPNTNEITDRNDPADINLRYSIGAEATYTLFDGGRSKSQAQQQAISKQIADIQFDDTKNTIRFQIEREFNTMVSSFHNIKINEFAVDQARKSLEIAISRRDTGFGTQLEVSNEQTALTRAESNRIASIINYNRSLIGLMRSVANPDLRLLPYDGVLKSASNH